MCIKRLRLSRWVTGGECETTHHAIVGGKSYPRGCGLDTHREPTSLPGEADHTTNRRIDSEGNPQSQPTTWESANWRQETNYAKHAMHNQLESVITWRTRPEVDLRRVDCYPALCGITWHEKWYLSDWILPLHINTFLRWLCALCSLLIVSHTPPVCCENHLFLCSM